MSMYPSDVEIIPHGAVTWDGLIETLRSMHFVPESIMCHLTSDQAMVLGVQQGDRRKVDGINVHFHVDSLLVPEVLN